MIGVIELPIKTYTGLILFLLVLSFVFGVLISPVLSDIWESHLRDDYLNEVRVFCENKHGHYSMDLEGHDACLMSNGDFERVSCFRWNWVDVLRLGHYGDYGDYTMQGADPTFVVNCKEK